MSWSLPDWLGELESRARGAGPLLVLLDFDGTLAPIAERPGGAALPADTRRCLQRLSVSPRVALGVISGRGIEDLRRRVAIEGLIYAGNHGMEIRGRGLSFIEPGADASRAALHDLVTRIREELSVHPGVEVEDKGLTASVHYRGAGGDSLGSVRGVVERVVRESPSGFRWSEGRMVYELRPDVEWNKGSAVDWLRRRLGVPAERTVFIGDDATDEDAFRVLGHGITIRVGPGARSLARYHLRDPAQVTELLGWLLGVMDSPHRTPMERESRT